jgi:hypothetical protein
MQNSPVFLVGAERSGTTLLRLMLDSHPLIHFQFEFEYVVDQLDAQGGWPAITDYHDYLSTHRIFLLHPFVIDKTLPYDELIRSFLQQKQQEKNKPIVGATVHYCFEHLPQFWPQARFIHIVRDGRDVARPNLKTGWHGLPYFGAKRWLAAEQSWMQLSQQITAEQQITIYYEKLIHDTDGVLKQLCDFLQIPFDAAMYDYTKNTHYKQPDLQMLEQWRKKMSRYQIRLVEAQIGALLQQHGYALSGFTPRHPGWLETALLKFWNNLSRVFFRMKRYPFPLYVQDVMSRRLGLKQWQKKVKLKINQIENEFLHS